MLIAILIFTVIATINTFLMTCVLGSILKEIEKRDGKDRDKHEE